jgi:hypothetical protein
VPGNNWVAKVATWLATAAAEPEPPIEAELARATELEVAAGQIASETAISHAVVAETGMFLEAAEGDTTDLDLAVAAVAAHPAWGLEEASVAVGVVGGAGSR